MNERIKQILLDAGGQYSLGNQNDWPSWVLGDAGVEKFAELIVRECGVALSPMLRDMVSRGQAFDLIKQHFGVEE